MVPYDDKFSVHTFHNTSITSTAAFVVNTTHLLKLVICCLILRVAHAVCTSSDQVNIGYMHIISDFFTKLT